MGQAVANREGSEKVLRYENDKSIATHVPVNSVDNCRLRAPVAGIRIRRRGMQSILRWLGSVLAHP